MRLVVIILIIMALIFSIKGTYHIILKYPSLFLVFFGIFLYLDYQRNKDSLRFKLSRLKTKTSHFFKNLFAFTLKQAKETVDLCRTAFVPEMPADIADGFIREMNLLTNEFEYLASSDENYFSYPMYSQWSRKTAGLSERFVEATVKHKSPKKLKERMAAFKGLLAASKEAKRKSNGEYLDKTILKEQSFFDSNEGARKLDLQQRKAVVCDEYRTLILAGAGSGKTEVIVNRCGYLLERKLVAPKDILMVTLTKKAANNMRERLLKRFNRQDIAISTVHSLAFNMVRELTGKKPTVFDDDNNSYSENSQAGVALRVFKNLIDQNESFKNNVLNYQLFYREIPKPETSFKTREEWEEYTKTLGEYKTLSNYWVKSHQEKIIADLLYNWGFAVEYETPYKFDTATKEHARYMPDFYLPEYDLYIEHFGVDRNMQPPKWFKDGGKNYVSDMEFKRQLHQTHGTNFIETFSYEAYEGTLAEKLLSEFKKRDIEPKEAKLDFNKFVKPEDRSMILKSLNNFMGLFKIGNHSIQDIRRKAETPREKIFIAIFETFFRAYTEACKRKSRCDFSDMIGDAISLIKEKGLPAQFQFKYIIVDEFQDIGGGAMMLLNLLAEKTPDCSLYFVGDDWQSIFNFAGSNISLILNFEQNHEGAMVLEMGTNYRSSPNIVDLGQRWISSSAEYRPKKVMSSISQRYDNRVLTTDEECIKTIKKYFSENKKGTIFVLGRYNADICIDPKRKAHYQDWLKKLVDSYPKGAIEPMTIHKSKGNEADLVFLLPSKNGFPTRFKDDEILKLVSTRKPGYEESEERRLMYVAITRAKKQVFFLRNANHDKKIPTFLNEIRDLVNSLNLVVKI